MTTAKISQATIEVIQSPSPSARLATASIEVIQIPASTGARVSQAFIEVLSKSKKAAGKPPGTGAAANNAAITPSLPSGLSEGDLLVCAVYGRQTTGSLSISGGWTEVVNHVGVSGAIGVWYQFYTGSPLPAAPTITPVGASAGDTIIGQVGAWYNIDPNAPFKRSIGVASNASQQNIGPITGDASGTAVAPDDVVIVVGGKSDSWTSVANITNFARLGSTASALGNRAGLVWDYALIDAPAAVSAKTFVVTGGSAAVGKGVQLVFQGLGEAAFLDVTLDDTALASTATTAISSLAVVDVTLDDTALASTATVAAPSSASVDVTLDDTVLHSAVSLEPLSPVPPAASVGGGTSRKRPSMFSIRGPAAIPSRTPAINATVACILDDVECDAFAEVGREERARTRRLAAIATILGV